MFPRPGIFDLLSADFPMSCSPPVDAEVRAQGCSSLGTGPGLESWHCDRPLPDRFLPGGWCYAGRRSRRVLDDRSRAEGVRWSTVVARVDDARALAA